MDWYQIGWIVVFCLFGAALIFAMLSNLLNRIGDLCHDPGQEVKQERKNEQEKGFHRGPPWWRWVYRYLFCKEARQRAALRS